MLKEKISRARQTAYKKYNIEVQSNVVDVLCEKLYERQSGVYVECGVHKGNTFLVAHTFIEQEGLDFEMIGYDSFAGFPEGMITSADCLMQFPLMYQYGFITGDHYEKARERTNNFTDREHLSQEFLADVGDVFEHCADLDNVKLVVGAFVDTLPDHDCSIDVLFLDCDLFLSYLFCMKMLYPHVNFGGVVVFDEYYSWKYPGPRLAVDASLWGEQGELTCQTTSDGFERWYFTKEKV